MNLKFWKKKEKKKQWNFSRLFYGKCGCGWGYTDYPFMNCSKCGYISCGSKKDIKKTRKNGTLIEWTQERPNIPSSEMKDWCVPDGEPWPSDDELYGLDSWEDSFDGDYDYDPIEHEEQYGPYWGDDEW